MEHFKKYLTVIAVLVCMMLIGCDSCISCNFYFDDEEKPDVSTEIVTETIQTKRYGSEYASGLTHCIGSVSVADNNVNFDRMMPGDGITFEIAINNNGGKAVEYRLKIDMDGELLPALIVTVDGKPYTTSADWTEWLKMAADEQVKKIAVAVEFDVNAGNEYCDKAANISYTVEVVTDTEADSSTDGGAMGGETTGGETTDGETTGGGTTGGETTGGETTGGETAGN